MSDRHSFPIQTGKAKKLIQMMSTKSSSTASRLQTKPKPKPKFRSIKEREAHFEDQQFNISSDLENLKAGFSVKFEDLKLKLSEFENDLNQQLEMEELNQQTFDHLKLQIQDNHAATSKEVSTLKSQVSRTVDSINMAMHELQRASEADRMTTQKKNLLHAEIERNVLSTITTTLENTMNREFENVKLGVKHTLIQSEKTDIVHQKSIQEMERRMYEQEQKMHEMTKFHAKLSALHGVEEQLNASPAHRISVIEFSQKGLNSRLVDMENSNSTLIEKIKCITANSKKELTVLAEKNKVELLDIAAENRLKLKNMLSEVTLILQNKMAAFTDDILEEGKENNKLAISEMESFTKKFKQTEDFTNDCIKSFETKIGRLAIDFDRLGGDTNAVCEALASGLQDCRKGLMGQKYLAQTVVVPPSPPPF